MCDLSFFSHRRIIFMNNKDFYLRPRPDSPLTIGVCTLPWKTAPPSPVTLNISAPTITCFLSAEKSSPPWGSVIRKLRDTQSTRSSPESKIQPSARLTLCLEKKRELYEKKKKEKKQTVALKLSLSMDSPTVNRARSRPSWDRADAVKLLHDSSTRFLPLRDLRLEATRASNTAAWPLSSIPPGTTFSEPIPSWKKRKWLSGQGGRERTIETF